MFKFSNFPSKLILKSPKTSKFLAIHQYNASKGIFCIIHINYTHTHTHTIQKYIYFHVHINFKKPFKLFHEWGANTSSDRLPDCKLYMYNPHLVLSAADNPVHEGGEKWYANIMLIFNMSI